MRCDFEVSRFFFFFRQHGWDYGKGARFHWEACQLAWGKLRASPNAPFAGPLLSALIAHAPALFPTDKSLMGYRSAPMSESLTEKCVDLLNRRPRSRVAYGYLVATTAGTY